ncbi:MAG: DUF1799 domain-containing protein [Erysipelotrichales bacterium]|nr:DUF1799 domain-containing protein [Erysipelotrichales bacterium]
MICTWPSNIPTARLFSRTGNSWRMIMSSAYFPIKKSLRRPI